MAEFSAFAVECHTPHKSHFGTASTLYS